MKFFITLACALFTSSAVAAPLLTKDIDARAAAPQVCDCKYFFKDFQPLFGYYLGPKDFC
ncbi:hypothetical protein Ptr902_02372 [Pyrenophora tritici-repentis]|uniref:Uncharacterized protein n=1 Tax=Pyrenophora tritici-repentis TaxID=45151 RepID=A0A5M9L3M9_9PLEO|nr:hypothetical protein PtrV1_09356 [Pyrenophora tritici-repentis]KAF7443200.1 hypothetical protein A1F99_127070 [Pyrenophora tritici-repentis]KAF7568329.1 hypothetical protein PtrM4_129420 [Pyrenophora tritici-repentis]KAI0568701.1 hypothetical protein Alg215_12039 [Pyrenophora tritici-repentis]KAI0571557.1 hypothetical protein Alg130_10842 [Pyrenophora tritici-repentis]